MNYFFVKRSFDILVSFVGIILLFPLFLLLSLVIALESGSPVLFKQLRVGKKKKLFYIYKFRTMRGDTPTDVPTHLLENPHEYTTKVGRFLRKYSLDELPQLVNVLRGDMSMIGPRPALYNEYTLIALRDKYGANDIKPGLTGLAQISGRDELSVETKARLDGEYKKKCSFCFDTRISLSTPLPVLMAKGVKLEECSDKTKNSAKTKATMRADYIGLVKPDMSTKR